MAGNKQDTHEQYDTSTGAKGPETLPEKGRPEGTRFRLIVGAVLALLVALLAYLLVRYYAIDSRRIELAAYNRHMADLLESIHDFETDSNGVEGRQYLLMDVLDRLIEKKKTERGDIDPAIEVVIGQRDGDSIRFLFAQSMQKAHRPVSVPFESLYAEPMRRALNGQTGTVIGIDYRAVQVLAAYTPVSGTENIATVAKIDMAAVLGPINRAALYGAAILLTLYGLLVLIAIRSEGRFLSFTRRTHRHYDAILDKMADGVVTIDGHGRIESFSPASERIFGYRREEILGRDVAMLMATPFAENHDAYVQAYLRGGKSRAVNQLMEVSGRRKDGEIFPLEITVTDIGTGQGALLCAVVRDITQRKASEKKLLRALDEAESANRAKLAFLANMSHEIRTPMNGVIGMIDLMERSLADHDQKHMAETVKTSATSLLNIIDDILDFSKIDADKLKLEIRPFLLTELVEPTVESLAPEAARKDVQLFCFMDPDLPRMVKGDVVRIRQILTNLIGNAIKFTTPSDGRMGQIEVLVNLIKRSRQEAEIEFSVQDNGIGIPADRRDQIFDPFSQAESSTTRRFGGTGLGLAITRRLTRMMDSEVLLESTPGEGSRFHFRLTMPTLPDEEAVSRSEWDFAGHHILIVGPSESGRNILKRYLEAAEADCLMAENLDQAVREIEAIEAGGHRLSAVVIGGGYNTSELTEMRQAFQRVLDHEQMRYVVLYNRVHREPEDRADTQRVPAYPLRRTDFLQAVAVALGMATSRESDRDEDAANRIAGSVPTPDEAEALDQLILLAEDNQTNRLVITKQLEYLGYAVLAANDGLEALALFQKRRFSLVLTDCHMPNMDGFELTRKLRGLETGRTVPIIAVTANALSGERERCLKAGMIDYISKPVEIDTLRGVIQKWLGRANGSHSSDAGKENTTRETVAIAPMQENEDSLIDFDQLNDLMGGIDEDLLMQALQLYRESLSELMEKIRLARAGEDSEAVREAAHALKGASLSICARELADVSRLMQSAAERSDWSSMTDLLVRAEEEEGRMLDYLKLKLG